MPRTRPKSDDFQSPAPSTSPENIGEENAELPVSKPRGPTPWLTIARAEDGTREAPGSKHNPKILGYFKDVHHEEIVDDETAWCAAFAGACLERAGYRSTRSLMAKSYKTWGKPTTKKIGAIAVLKRGNDPRFGHVGFVVGWNDKQVYLLGGNQSNMVNVTKFPLSQVEAYRWPTTLLNSRTVQGGTVATVGTIAQTAAETIPATPPPALPDPDVVGPLQDAGNSLVTLGDVKWWLAAIGTALIIAGIAWMLYARWHDYQNKGR